MSHPSGRWLGIAVGILLAATTVSSAQACGLFRCWFCAHHGHHGYQSSYSTYSSPSQAPSAQQTPAQQMYTLSAPSVVYYTAAPQQTPTGAQNFLPELTTAIEVFKLIKGLREGVDNSQKQDTDPGTPTTTTVNLDEVKASIAKLEEGQKELQGQIINVAGISQSIGQELVKVHTRVAAIEQQTGATGQMFEKLAEINRSIQVIGEGGEKPKDAPSAGVSESAELRQTVKAMQKDLGELKSQMTEIRTLLGDREKAREKTDKKPEPPTAENKTKPTPAAEENKAKPETPAPASDKKPEPTEKKANS